MKNKFIRQISVFLAAVLLLLQGTAVSAQKDETAQMLKGILDFKLDQAKADTVQEWIDCELSQNADTNEWYIIALCQYGDYEFSKYETALAKKLTEKQVTSASSRQKYALALVASASTDSYIYTTLNDSIGKQGVMSWIFGLHLLNNGYESKEYTLSEVKEKLLSLQLESGGWAVVGSNGEIDATAMAVQALAPYYNTESTVKGAIDKALSFLSGSQSPDGDYVNYGANNAESTAQVFMALSSLGINGLTDTRFIKNGNTLLDAMSRYRLSDGSFCHSIGGAYNSTATVQALCALVAYQRMLNGKSTFYLLDRRNPEGLKIPQSGGDTSSVSSAVSKNETAASSKVISSAAQSTVTSQSKSGQTSSENETAEDDPSEPNHLEDQSELSESTVSSAQKNTSQGGGYKLWVCIGIAVLAAAIILIMIFSGKRNIKNIAAVGIIAVVAIVLVYFINIQSVSDYNSVVSKENAIGTVELSVDCSKIEDKSAAHIPDNGCLIESTEFEIENGDTAYDILLQAVKENKVHLETDGSGNAVYIKGIGNIYEFDYGELSGWIYTVNGEQPSVSCGEYVLSPDDKIEFIYSLELGKDVQGGR